ncbi:CPBP family intramembrane glutamic endopeptidase [Polycladidibacter hongkongensis]|uniref:CPBP family intramembrane glutamic endopeptidase n=1 Tax=Polycladidibacter hongkongensis TaxID=1647556 RepID=UPI000ABD0C50|nr:CPBP family intramembrane glutamic endopeptidase [Pseudovibrio hongkongensis]
MVALQQGKRTCEQALARRDAGIPQYSLAKILGIWAIVSVPMPLLAFVLAPVLVPEDLVKQGLVIWLLLIGGMVWQWIVAMVLLWQEGALQSFAVFRQRIWLLAPRRCAGGKADLHLFWWLIPAFMVYAAAELSVIGQLLSDGFATLVPELAQLPQLDLRVLAVEENVGNWWLLLVAGLSFVFNYFLGEELLFRGVLLPRMRGVFGKWDWLANAVLFATYHLHRPLIIPATIIGGMAWSYPSRRFRSIWFAIIPHMLEGVFLVVAVGAVVAGLAV